MAKHETTHVEEHDEVGPADIQSVIDQLQERAGAAFGSLPTFVQQLDKAIERAPEVRADIEQSIAAKVELRELISKVGPDGERIAQLVYEFVAGLRG